MEKMFIGILFIIGLALRIIGALFLMLWEFKFNPIIEQGSRNGYLYEDWDYKLWDWVFIGVKPEYRRYEKINNKESN